MGGKEEMKGKFQWRLDLEIQATPDKVWETVDDISMIPQYHPEVGTVTLLDGKQARALGVKYQCNVLEGKGEGSCVEEVSEYIPYVKVSTRMGEDTWGLDKIFADFVVESTLIPKDDHKTLLRFEGFYNPIGVFNKVLNPLILRRKTKDRSLSVMKGIKRLCEK